ncbi:MAG: heavy metal translocating P-type ATPase [Candidatus Cryptobacteroides sp.]
MEAENKKRLTRIVVSTVLLVVAIIAEKTIDLKIWQQLLIYLIPYLIVGYETLAEAVESIFKGKALDEDFLMAIATIGALSIGFLPGAATCFPEAVFVMLFFQVGELFEEIAEGNSRRSIKHLLDIRPDTANLLQGDKVVKVDAEKILPGDNIVIIPGERIPVDGEIIEGTSNIDAAALTGESVPLVVGVGDEVLSGCVNISGVLKVKARKAFTESTASKIIELVENASEKKSSSERFITRFAKRYTPIVVLIAVILAFLPPMLSGNFSGNFHVWLYRALTFLVVSCPCALVISVPLTFFGGLGAASKKGILVKGANYLELLAKIDTVVLDKTGTLTEGVFDVTAVHPEEITEKQLLHLAAHVERFSTHPIALSLKEAYPDESDGCEVAQVEEFAGLGVKAKVNGDEVLVGNSRFMEERGVDWRPCEKTGTLVHVARNGEYLGHIVISDKVKKDAFAAISDLKCEGVRRLVMLTGDKEEVAAAVAGEVGIEEYHSGLFPTDKVEEVEKMLLRKPENKALVFVGDGINDAPVLARADVGIAMGGLGSDAAIEAADVVIMNDRPSNIAKSIRIARKTLKVATENIVFAIGIKVLVLILASLGFATMWMAVFADVGVTVLATLNAMRMLRNK